MIISQTTEINAFYFFYMFLFIVFFGRCTHLNIEVPSEAPNNNRQGKRGKPLQYTSNGIETMSFDARLLSFLISLPNIQIKCLYLQRVLVRDTYFLSSLSHYELAPRKRKTSETIS